MVALGEPDHLQDRAKYCGKFDTSEVQGMCKYCCNSAGLTVSDEAKDNCRCSDYGIAEDEDIMAGISEMNKYFENLYTAKARQ